MSNVAQKTKTAKNAATTTGKPRVTLSDAQLVCLHRLFCRTARARRSRAKILAAAYATAALQVYGLEAAARQATDPDHEVFGRFTPPKAHAVAALTVGADAIRSREWRKEVDSARAWREAHVRFANALQGLVQTYQIWLSAGVPAPPRQTELCIEEAIAFA